MDGAQSKMRGLGKHSSSAETTPTSVFVLPVPGGPCSNATPMHGRTVSGVSGPSAPGLTHRRMASAWFALNSPASRHVSMTRSTSRRFLGAMPMVNGSGFALWLVPGMSALPLTEGESLFQPT